MGARLAAYLSYRDAPAALRRMQAVGFTVLRQAGGGDGTVTHAEVRCDDVVLMVASYDADYRRAPLAGPSTGSGLHLVLDDAADVDDRFARRVAAGGTAVLAPQDTEWGTRRARVLDPEGQEWSSGTYAPGSTG